MKNLDEQPKEQDLQERVALALESLAKNVGELTNLLAQHFAASFLLADIAQERSGAPYGLVKGNKSPLYNESLPPGIHFNPDTYHTLDNPDPDEHMAMWMTDSRLIVKNFGNFLKKADWIKYKDNLGWRLHLSCDPELLSLSDVAFFVKDQGLSIPIQRIRFGVVDGDVEKTIQMWPEEQMGEVSPDWLDGI